MSPKYLLDSFYFFIYSYLCLLNIFQQWAAYKILNFVSIAELYTSLRETALF